MCMGVQLRSYEAKDLRAQRQRQRLHNCRQQTAACKLNDGYITKQQQQQQ